MGVEKRALRSRSGESERWSAGDEMALDRLVELVYDDLRRIARQQLRGEGRNDRNDRSRSRVVLSAEEYTRLTNPQNLVRFLRESPLAEASAEGDLDLTRSRDTGRDISF